MVNFLKRIFGIREKAVTGPASASRPDQLLERQQAVIKLRELIGETIALYNSVSCACAFPRLRQVVSIDCIDYRKAFYATETEYFIDALKPCYDIQAIPPGNTNSDDWTCKTCGSTWVYQWEDFSISVSRAVLKPKKLKVKEAGPAATLPIPLFIGLGGHGFPPKTEIAPVDFDTFRKYMQEVL